MQFLDSKTTKDQLKAKLDSRDWWLLLDPWRTGWLGDLEERFYGGEKNDGYHVLVGGDMPGWYCATALKEHCPPTDMARWINGHSAINVTPTILETQDVLGLTDLEHSIEDHVLYMTAFQAWLYR